MDGYLKHAGDYDQFLSRKEKALVEYLRKGG